MEYTFQTYLWFRLSHRLNLFVEFSTYFVIQQLNVLLYIFNSCLLFAGVQERFVEITFCAHILRGLNELTESNMAEMSLKDWVCHFNSLSPKLSSVTLTNYLQPVTKLFMLQLERGDRGMICNYRFIREFTKGVEGQWLINYINHFKL